MRAGALGLPFFIVQFAMVIKKLSKIASFINDNVSIDLNKQTTSVKEARGSTKAAVIQARYRDKSFKT